MSGGSAVTEVWGFKLGTLLPLAPVFFRLGSLLRAVPGPADSMAPRSGSSTSELAGPAESERRTTTLFERAGCPTVGDADENVAE